MHRDFHFYEIAVFLSHWWSDNYREQRANVRDYPSLSKGLYHELILLIPLVFIAARTVYMFFMNGVNVV